MRLYLTAASKERLHEYMQTIGAPNFSADYVVMKDHATREDCLEYDSKGVLGHRVGFRLKGIAFGDGFISVSTLLLGHVRSSN